MASTDFSGSQMKLVGDLRVVYRQLVTLHDVVFAGEKWIIIECRVCQMRVLAYPRQFESDFPSSGAVLVCDSALDAEAVASVRDQPNFSAALQISLVPVPDLRSSSDAIHDTTYEALAEAVQSKTLEHLHDLEQNMANALKVLQQQWIDRIDAVQKRSTEEASRLLNYAASISSVEPVPTTNAVETPAVETVPLTRLSAEEVIFELETTETTHPETTRIYERYTEEVVEYFEVETSTEVVDKDSVQMSSSLPVSIPSYVFAIDLTNLKIQCSKKCA